MLQRLTVLKAPKCLQSPVKQNALTTETAMVNLQLSETTEMVETPSENVRIASQEKFVLHNWEQDSDTCNQNITQYFLCGSPLHIISLQQAAVTKNLEDRFEQLLHDLAALNQANFEGNQLSAGCAALKAAKSMFNSTTGIRLAGLYFHHHQAHAPVIHIPSFNTLTVSSVLLIAVITTGAFYSPNKKDVSAMRGIMELVELYIFDNSAFINLLHGYGAKEMGFEYVEQLESVQAAFVIIIAHYWEGDVDTRIRIRGKRMSQVVKVSNFSIFTILGFK
jgi:Fungal specific transcription factor domain